MALTPEQRRQRMRRTNLMMAYAYAAASTKGWTPLQLATGASAWAWYDPSDQSTLFQDSAGTTRVTTAGDPVGLILDKSGNGLNATQSTAAACPIYRIDANGRPYLEFDGTDDSLATGVLSLGSVDKADLILGVRKLVDTAAAVVVGMGNNAYTQPGALVLTAPDGVNSTYGLRLTGAGGTNRGYSIAAAAPDTSVLSYGLDIGSASLAQNVRPRRNAAVPSLTSIGAGFTPTTFSDVPLFIGVNGTSGARFNGWLYGLIVRFSSANLDATAIANAEAWMNGKTGAF